MSLFALAVVTLVPGAGSGTVRLGNEFQVNRFTAGAQSYPVVAAADDGDFVVVWESDGQDGDSYGVFLRRFSSAGAPLATELQVSTRTIDSQGLPSVAASASGDFVVAWQSGTLNDGQLDIVARRFSSAGAALGVEFLVNTYTTGKQQTSAVAADADGDFVVAWRSLGQDGYAYGVFARRFSSAGAALAVEFQVSAYTSGSQSNPAVAAAAGGAFVVAWNSQVGVSALRFSSAGDALATEFQVNAALTGAPNSPAVAADDAGNFVVAWESRLDGDEEGISARRFSSAGVSLGTQFQVNLHTLDRQVAASVSADSDGDFVVAWDSKGQDSYAPGVFARRFSSAGVAVAGEFQVNTYTTEYQSLPSVAADDNGNFVVVWRSGPDQDGSQYGVFAQRFAVSVLDIDGDGSALPLTDGLLALRYLFGFRGATLIAGVVGGDCTRCDAPAIETYIGVLVAAAILLDIDDDGEAEPLSDGLMALRYLFGFRGATLVSGVVDLGDCQRCDAATIEPYLAGLTN